MASFNHDDLDLTLSLAIPSSNGNNPPIADPPLNRNNSPIPASAPAPSLNGGNRDRDIDNNNVRVWSEIIEKPYLWALNKRAKVESLIHLRSEGIHSIKGDVQCKRCENRFEMEYELMSSFNRVKKFIENSPDMSWDGRARKRWMKPVLPDCKFCGGKNCVNPVKSSKKRKINWLFLLLGNMLGCCTIKELKYFCKHNNVKHRTGAKDRVLYQTYLVLCNQLEPNPVFSLSRLKLI